MAKLMPLDSKTILLIVLSLPAKKRLVWLLVGGSLVEEILECCGCEVEKCEAIVPDIVGVITPDFQFVGLRFGLN
jgi:hypothetical protein